MHVIAKETWQLARVHHEQVVQRWVSNRLHRRSHGLKHPVDDFLFEYYPISANKLATWHPGIGIALEIDDETKTYFDPTIYQIELSEVRVDSDWQEKKKNELKNTIEFLKSTANRPPQTGCFGLHEWAMVLHADEVRHFDWPLRVSQHEIEKTINNVGLRCTHFDAFRFFTEQARPLNPLQIVRADQKKLEQPGCLHANMDLYKIAHQWAPLLGSVFVRSCFRLAKSIRTLDMQGAPYDLSKLGVQPIPLETPIGRAEFAQQQKSFSSHAQILRHRLIARLSSVSRTLN